MSNVWNDLRRAELVKRAASMLPLMAKMPPRWLDHDAHGDELIQLQLLAAEHGLHLRRVHMMGVGWRVSTGDLNQVGLIDQVLFWSDGQRVVKSTITSNSSREAREELARVAFQSTSRPQA